MHDRFPCFSCKATIFRHQDNGLPLSRHHAERGAFSRLFVLVFAWTSAAARLGPISEQFPFDYLPAILNNIESTYLAVNGLKPGDGKALTDEQVRKLADSLKTSLGQQVAAELAKRLND